VLGWPESAGSGGTFLVAELVRNGVIPVQIGFQRRFDAGLRATRDMAASGSLAAR